MIYATNLANLTDGVQGDAAKLGGLHCGGVQPAAKDATYESAYGRTTDLDPL